MFLYDFCRILIYSCFIICGFFCNCLASMTSDSSLRALLTELCVAELEEVSGNESHISGGGGGLIETNQHHQLHHAAGAPTLGLFGLFGLASQPVVQESSHPYTDDTTLTGHVVLPGAESLRVEFDRLCSTEKRHDPLTLMDAVGRIVAIRSGRDWTADWSQQVSVSFLSRFVFSVHGVQLVSSLRSLRFASRAMNSGGGSPATAPSTAGAGVSPSIRWCRPARPHTVRLAANASCWPGRRSLPSPASWSRSCATSN